MLPPGVPPSSEDGTSPSLPRGVQRPSCRWALVQAACASRGQAASFPQGPGLLPVVWQLVVCSSVATAVAGRGGALLPSVEAGEAGMGPGAGHGVSSPGLPAPPGRAVPACTPGAWLSGTWRCPACAAPGAQASLCWKNWPPWFWAGRLQASSSLGCALWALPAGVCCEQLWAEPVGAEGTGMGCGRGTGRRAQGSCLFSDPVCHWALCSLA